jgi:chitinase
VMTWMKRAMVALLIVVACGTTSSGATYTASSTNPQTFGAAADFGLDVEMADPGPTMRGTRSMSATPTVTDGVAVSSVRIQRAPTGTGTWTTICTDSGAPYTCSLDTTTLTDGLYDFRAQATNANGYTRTSAAVVGRRVDNTAPSITQRDPGAWFRGALTLDTTTLSDGGGSGIAQVRYEYRLSTLGTWTTACTASSTPFSCTFPTSGLLDGTNYDFRAVATDVAGNSTTTAAITNRKPDNTAPTGTIVDPGLNLRLTVAVELTAADLHSGVASVAVQYAPAGGGSWSTGCVVTTAPLTSCNWDTTSAPDGLLDLRSVVTDVAGNTYTTTAILNRRVDNLAPLLSFTDPGAYLRGTVTFNASASDSGSGLSNLKIDYKTTAASTWSSVCSAATSPLSCSVNTTGVADGSYDLRAVATDVAGNSSTTEYSGRLVDNTAPTAFDVQTGNGGTTAGRIDVNDYVTFTYSETVKPSTILAGWAGTATAVRVFVDNRATNDRWYVYHPSNNAVLPVATELTLNRDYVSTDTWFGASMTQTDAAIRVTLTSFTSGGVSTPGGTPTMSWSPSSSVTDLAGNPASTTARSEQGAADRDF